jgi:hypothetical protein
LTRNTELTQQLGMFEGGERRVRLGYEQRIARRHRLNEPGIDREVVGLDVTRPACPPVALERFAHEQVAALSRQAGENRSERIR